MKELELIGIALDGGSRLYVERKNMKELTAVGMYKDGGSKRFVSTDGEEYWQCFRLGTAWEHLQGKLFIGNINDENQVLAKGEFVLISKNKAVMGLSVETRTTLVQK
mgnify:CR=1 FL=1|jgi:hypothetical protein